MIEIVTDEHRTLIESLFEESTETIKIISPFLSMATADLLCNAANKGVDCSFITRFYLQDFLDGSNTLEGLQNMKNAGVKLYALIGLHTKLYLFDCMESIVGSANFTEAGLSRNVELSIHLVDEPIIDELQEYYDDIVGRVKVAVDGVITQDMIDDFQDRYMKIKMDEKSKLAGGTIVVTSVKGAALDRISKGIKEDSNKVFEEIEANTNERISDVVYAAMGGKREKASHKKLNNILLKFSASSRRRDNGDELMNMPSFADNGKRIYISNFSEARKKSATTIEEGDETFFCVHSYDVNGKACPLIVGKGFFRAYNRNNDARLKGWVSQNEWLKDYPIYCVLSEAKVIDAPIKYGIPLRDLTDHLGYRTYMHTKDKPEKYPKEKVATLHKQRAMLELTPEAKEFLDERLEVLGKEYGWITYKSEK